MSNSFITRLAESALPLFKRIAVNYCSRVAIDKDGARTVVPEETEVEFLVSVGQTGYGQTSETARSLVVQAAMQCDAARQKALTQEGVDKLVRVRMVTQGHVTVKADLWLA